MTKTNKTTKSSGAKNEKRPPKQSTGKRTPGDLPKLKVPVGSDVPVSPHGVLMSSSPLPSGSRPVSSSSSKLWFQSEIIGMMYAFGDCRKPSPESAAIVETVVHQQMCNLLVQAADVTNMCGGKFMSIDDILYLMKRDKEKLRRVIRHFAFKDNVKSRSIKQASQEDEDIVESAAGDSGKTDNKRLKLAYDFISSIDNTGELVALFDDDGYADEVKQQRLERAERISRSLDHQSYLEFVEARQANFNKKAGRFKEWLDIGSLIDVKPSGAVLEILSYLAYETVGQIVDLSLLVKQDQKRPDMVFSVMPPSLNPQTDLMKAFNATPRPATSSTTGTSGHTPPGTPSNSTSNSTSATSLILPAQGGLASSLGTASLASSGLIKPPKAKKKKTKHGSANGLDVNGESIQPHHIREAIRRYNQASGPMAPFSRPFVMNVSGNGTAKKPAYWA